MMPKGYRTDINLNEQKVGVQRREEIEDIIIDKSTYLPKSVLEEDMDQGFIEFMNSNTGLSLVIDGEVVPVIFLTIQRWHEFSQTWQFSDKYKNIKLPFITVIRNPDIQQGENHAGLWNIPGKRTYTYLKVPTWDGIREGIDLYKIPQPTSVDLTYEVRIFTAKMKDLNEFNRKVQIAFQSRQCYISINGHPMPLHIESIGDESNIEDFENKRFYVQMFEIKLLGYIMDEKDYEIIPTINRTLLTMEISENRKIIEPITNMVNNNGVLTYNFIFEPNSINELTFSALYDINLIKLILIVQITRIIIYVNGVGVFDGTILTTPILIKQNDIIRIKVTKNNIVNSSFTLIGNIL